MSIERTTIGQMRDVIEILKVESNPYGDFSVENTYTPILKCRARVRNLSEVGSKRGIGDSTTAYTHVVIIRRGQREIDNDNMIKWGNNMYRIIGVEHIARTANDPKKRFTRIYMSFSHTDTALDNPSPED